MRVQTRQPTKIPSQLHPLAEVLARRDFRRNSETAFGKFEPIFLAAGDVVRILFQAPVSVSSTTTYLFDGGSSAFNRAIILLGKLGEINDAYDWSALWKLDGVRVPNGCNYPVDGKLHVLEVTATEAVVGRQISRLGARFTNNETFQGVLANFEIVRNGTAILDCPLKKYPPNPNIIENKAKPLGAEVWHYADAVDYDLGGAYRLISGTHGGSPVEAGTTYLVSAYLETDGSTYFEMGDTTGPARASFPATTGWVTFIVKTPSPLTSTCMRWSTSGSGPFTGSITNVSIRKAEGWGQYINPLDEDWGAGPFELQWNGDWLGKPFISVDNLLFDEAASWANIFQITGLTAGARYQLLLDLTTSTGELFLVNKASSTGPASYDNDIYVIEFTATNHDAWLQTYGAGSTGSINRLVVKEVLKSA